jgi:hypothetical protein
MRVCWRTEILKSGAPGKQSRSEFRGFAAQGSVGNAAGWGDNDVDYFQDRRKMTACFRAVSRLFLCGLQMHE